MAYKLHMNGVITGCLNSFCLACDSFLMSEEEAFEHIGTSLHSKNIGAVQYSDKFKDAHIRKFQNGYFCEFCNVLLPIAAKVNIHITEEEHKRKKAILLLRLMGKGVVAFNNILIEEKAWHGLKEEICTVCNAEFESEEEHKNIPSHCLNLVQKPVIFYADNAIYRQLEDSVIQCLTCNKLFALSIMTKHFEDFEHQELFSKHRIQNTGHSEKLDTEESLNIETIDSINNDCEKDKTSSEEQKFQIVESILKYQSKGININLETETAVCKKCSEVVNFGCNEIENHIKKHLSPKKIVSELLYPSNLDHNLNRVDINDKTTKLSYDLKNGGDFGNKDLNMIPASGTAEDINGVKLDSANDEDIDTCCSASVKGSALDQDEARRQFARENCLTYKEDNTNNTYCRICDVRLPSSLNCMKEHVAGANHKKRESSYVAKSANLTRIDSREFIRTVYQIKDAFYGDCIVNEEYCLPRYSFFLISHNQSRFRCIICENNLPSYHDVERHLKARTHADKFLLTPMIETEELEFIREVRPNVFHCGYCNLMSSWAEMKQHLNCTSHKVTKTACKHRLKRYMPSVQNHKMKERLTMFWLLNMLH